MKFFFAICANLATFATAAVPRYNGRALDSVLSKRQNSVKQSLSSLVVDLGYEQHKGVQNASTCLDTWKGYGICFPID
jgi:hypothetical protein